MTKKQVKVVVHEAEGISFGIPSDPVGFMNYWQDLINKIPSDRLSSAVVGLSSSADYDGSDVDIEIYYRRDKTPEEQAAEEKLAVFNSNRQRASDFVRLQALGQKYNLRITPIKGDNNE